MMPGLHTFGSCALASDTKANTALIDGDATNPFQLYLDGVKREHSANPIESEVLISSLQGSHSLGEPHECSFILINPFIAPFEGQEVRLTYYADVLFAGTIRDIELSHNNTLTAIQYHCTCTDWTELLSRHVILRNFQEAAPHNIITSLLDNELAGNGLSIGTIDTVVSLPLVDSQGGTALELVGDIAASTGQILLVDDQRRINLLAVSAPSGPMDLTTSTVLSASIGYSRDDYRNVQTARVTGTPADGSDEDPLIVDSTDQNDEEITERQAIEGTNGRYESFDEITHPTSNNATLLQLMGQSYCTAKLAIAGKIKQTLRCSLIGYGWRPGQSVLATFETLGVGGDWYVQRVSYRTDIPGKLLYDLELSITSLRQRAWSAWLRIIDRGKIVVQLPGVPASTAVTETFANTGAQNWTVPANVYSVTITAIGASGAGGGSNVYWDRRDVCFISAGVDGKKGGNGGYAVATVSVTPGQELNLVVGTRGGTGGAAGVSGESSCATLSAPGTGTSATVTTVHRAGVLLVQANGGTGGSPTVAGSPGGGSGGIVTIGGGKTGGAGGYAFGTALTKPGQVGKHGEIQIAYVVTP